MESRFQRALTHDNKTLQTKLVAQLGQTLPRYQLGPHFCQKPFILGGVHVKQQLGNYKIDDRISHKLVSLITLPLSEFHGRFMREHWNVHVKLGNPEPQEHLQILTCEWKVHIVHAFCHHAPLYVLVHRILFANKHALHHLFTG